MSKFGHRARRVNHRVSHPTNSSRAKNFASQHHEKDTLLWQKAYESRLVELDVEDRLKILDDARTSVELNKDLELKNFHFGFD